MKNKIILFSFIILLVSLFTTSKVYAWTDEELLNTKTKHEYGKYYSIDRFYATPNIDANKTIKLYSKYLIFNGMFPECDMDNEIYMEIEDYPKDSDMLMLKPHKGIGENVYSKMTRINQIESYDSKAEYVIGISNYDQILILLDGNTYKENIGDIINDFFQTKVEENYQKKLSFTMPYASAASDKGALAISRYRDGADVYMASCFYQVGFNLLKESPQTQVEDNLDDPSIYGGNEETVIDDTPTLPDKKEENKTFKIIGIIASSIISILGIYLIYVLIKKIYQIMKG